MFPDVSWDLISRWSVFPFVSWSVFPVVGCSEFPVVGWGFIWNSPLLDIVNYFLEVISGVRNIFFAPAYYDCCWVRGSWACYVAPYIILAF